MMKYLPLILKNSLRNRKRTSLTVASIAVSFCLLGFLLAMYRVLFFGNDPTPAQALRLFTHHRVSLSQPMPASYEAKIASVPGVKAVTVWQWFGGVYKDARDPKNFFMRMAAEPDKVFSIFSELQIPEDQKLAFQHDRTGCIAAKALVDRLGWKPGQHITIVGDIFPVNLELTLDGIFDTPDHVEMLVFNHAYLRESLPPSIRDIVSAYLVQAQSPEDVPRVARAIDTMFENSPAPTKSETERAFQLSFVSFLGNLKLFLMALCGAVTFTILLVSGNTLSMAVRERVREIGILKTLGFTSGAILGIILGEAGMVAVTGGTIGCALAAGMCGMLRRSVVGVQYLKVLHLTPGIVAITLAVALVIGIVSALLPGARAARTPIVSSLRYTG
ncbi:MAG TPA: FtsX-like permease family protein [Bryobacteraceae bacterium]|nr:FtsX-like permease family protein [Bryobacteraceae bacterium]